MSEEQVKQYEVLKEFNDHHIGEILDGDMLQSFDVPGLIEDGTLGEVEADASPKVGEACTTENGKDGVISEDFVCVANLPEEEAVPASAEEAVNGERHPMA